MTTAPDYYEVLGLAHGASTEDVKASYRRIIRGIHPDAGGTATDALLRIVNQAHETLSDPARRAAYDASLERPPEPEPVPGPEPQPEDEWVVDDWAPVDEPEPDRWLEHDWTPPPTSQPQPQPQPARPRRRVSASWPWELRALTWPMRAGWRRAGRTAANIVDAGGSVFFKWSVADIGLGIVGFVALVIAVYINHLAVGVVLLAAMTAQVYWGFVGVRACGIKISRRIHSRRQKR